MRFIDKYFCYLKGSTAYELQIGRIIFRWVYLTGGDYYKHWYQLNRFQVDWDNTNLDEL